MWHTQFERARHIWYIALQFLFHSRIVYLSLRTRFLAICFLAGCLQVEMYRLLHTRQVRHSFSIESFLCGELAVGPVEGFNWADLHTYHWSQSSAGNDKVKSSAQKYVFRWIQLIIMTKRWSTARAISVNWIIFLRERKRTTNYTK